ncbi:MAG TPA: potassium/proton antiporter [Anaeromyxobacter sp.]|nr:potassium/proton antiporter [Anaeromyxobacter sp.]
MPTEPLPTAFLLAAVGALLAVSVIASRASGRLGLPVALLFLLVGMLAGSEGLGRLPFEDYALTFRIGAVALVLILFDGGLNIDLASLRRVLAPATVLATAGVAGTAAVLALGARALGLGWPESLLVGAIVSSTDAAAVFSTLRSAGVSIRQRLAHLLEVESGVNDPMAVILTLTVTGALVTGERPGPRLALEVILQLAIGLAAGVAIGYAGRWLLARVRLSASGLYPVLTIALACFAFGAPTLLSGSGFVAVYAAAVVLGNGPLPHASGLRRVHDAMAWFSQVAMFLLLGLLAFPSRLVSVAGPGLFLGLFLALVARPIVVFAMLLPFRMPLREIAFVSWVGLRGAVPIMLGTFPILAGLPYARHVFDLVFFVVVVSALVQGSTIGWVARRLGLEVQAAPSPRAVLEINSTQRLSGEVISFYVERASAVAGSRISDLTIPEGSAVMLVVRGRELLAARGRTVLEPGDHVYVFTSPGDKPFVQLLFGRQEED